MSWIRSDENLPRHPKTIKLKNLLGIDLDAVIGRLHFLWWWCLQYALDGDLRKHDPKVVEEACKIPFESLCQAGFIDARPYRRIHDWWDNQGNYLKLRYKDQPDKWNKIKALYERRSKLRSELPSKHQSLPNRNPVDVDLHTDVRTFHTERTYGQKREKKQHSREASPRLGASPPRVSPALVAKVDNDDAPDFDHEDFLKVSWLKSDMPANEFEWAHLERSLPDELRVMSKLREKSFLARKWN